MLLLLLVLLLALELEGSTWWKILESVRCACFFFFCWFYSTTSTIHRPLCLPRPETEAAETARRMMIGGPEAEPRTMWDHVGAAAIVLDARPSVSLPANQIDFPANFRFYEIEFAPIFVHSICRKSSCGWVWRSAGDDPLKVIRFSMGWLILLFHIGKNF